MKSVLAVQAASLAFLVVQHAEAVDDSNDRQTHAAQGLYPLNIDDAPLTIAASSCGRFARGYSWYLSVNSSGRASLTISTVPEVTVREFVVSPEDIERLRACLKTQRFFELKGEYGGRGPDIGCQTVTVTAGQETKTVALWYLMGYRDSDDSAETSQVMRAITVRQLIRGWFDEPLAADLRRYENLLRKSLRRKQFEGGSSEPFKSRNVQEFDYRQPHDGF